MFESFQLFLLQTPDTSPQSRPFDVNVVWKTINNLVYGFLEQLPYIFIGILVFVLFLIIGKIIKKAIYTAGQRTRLDLTLADLLGRIATFLITILGLFVSAVIIFPAFKPGDLIAGLGITSVAVGFAFKDVLQNFFAGVLILWRRPFIIGDQIKFGNFEGTVEEITVRSTRIKTYDNERAVIPNGEIYSNAVLIRTAFAKRRLQFVVGIGYPDSIEKARETIHRVLRETKGVLDDPGPWVYVSELAASSVNFTVYFWALSPQANILQVKDAVVTGIKLALDEAGIDMPFPHNVVLFHDVTGTREGDNEQTKDPVLQNRTDSKTN